VIDSDTPGLSIAARIDLIAPHPMGTLNFDACRVPLAAGWAGRAKVSRSRCAHWIFFEPRSRRRRLDLHNEPWTNPSFTQVTPYVRPQIGGVPADPDCVGGNGDRRGCGAAAHLSGRLASRQWTASHEGQPAMAKLTATETAQRVNRTGRCRCWRPRGGAGEIVERLYRDIRALRIYEAPRKFKNSLSDANYWPRLLDHEHG